MTVIFVPIKNLNKTFFYRSPSNSGSKRLRVSDQD